MAETFFLSRVASYLSGAGLTPVPKQVGGAEPAAVTELPAIVLSLDTTSRVNPGLGERAQLITGGVLPVQARINLANPVLPDEPTFTLLDAARLQLVLPHGGLIRQDGSDPGVALLSAGDITVLVRGAAVTVVARAPVAGEASANPRIGTLTFGTPLPLTGFVDASYFLGQWEQRLERITGTLRIDVCADNSADTLSLSNAVVDAMLAPAAQQGLRRLIALAPVSVGSVGIPELSPVLRRRTTRLSFTFEREVNRPDSSGGVIARIPVTSRMANGADPPGITPLSTEQFTVPA